MEKKYFKLIYFLLIVPLIMILNLIFGEKILIYIFQSIGYKNIVSIYENTIYLGSCLGDIITILILFLVYRLSNKNIFSNIFLLNKKLSKNDLLLNSILLLILSIIFSNFKNIGDIKINVYMILNLLIIIFIIPILEEIIFRFFILKNIFKILNLKFISIFISSILFSFVHIAFNKNIIQAIYTFILGVVLGNIYLKRENMYENIMLHIIFNFFGIILPIIAICIK